MQRIRVETGMAKAVEQTDGGVLTADLVLSNADAAHLYSAMIPNAAPGWARD